MDFIAPFQRAMMRVPQAPVASAITALLVLLTLYVAAQIVWQLLPQPNEAAPRWSPSAQAPSGRDSGSIEPLLALKLFGKADPKAAAAKAAEAVDRNLISDAPKTTLRILLTGLVASSQEDRGIAIIESSGSQETYGIGDRIKSTNASLHEVYADRAIILNQGRYETLMLDGVEYSREMTQETQRLRKAPVTDVRDDAEVSQAVADARQAMLSDPGKLTDFISISPVRNREEGGMKGYRLNPGKKGRELFVDAGLKPNDLAVSINGYDLTDLGQAAQLMGELSELTEASVMVEREGQLTEVLFSLPTE
ncbi:type II secretion system protein GspC [Ferrimonas lipolytica]|uniref:Type II secretion system protein GspC n=1 Tax=Ferrimonas lipolytica TaxID=2724191 RepID=A0A6H1UIH6_9GAMM|nr:type II secretion system protein GspC [Ferrimonas lipolytica]QIZ78410.1 type II secretion system protein GspC [Ferrimonas lipolytica]